ncbi:MAG: hypothetical protein ACI8Y7_000432 [Candidatus Woesearchaeota archaeon]|jgi:hypothetical protein
MSVFIPFSVMSVFPLVDYQLFFNEAVSVYDQLERPSDKAE